MMKNNKKAFTLAEILITLTVIGIVAAISLPALMQNVNERAWDAKRKALHVRMTHAILDLPKVRGYGEYKEETVDGNKVVTDTAAETFLMEGLSKVYKIKNTCNSNHLDKCGVPKKFTSLQGNSKNMPLSMSVFSINDNIKPTSAVAFETENGEKIALYYNPYCKPYREVTTDPTLYPSSSLCAHMVYDLNGLDEPNKMGKDMGIISVVYSPAGLEVVAPNPYYKQVGAAGSAPHYSADGTDAMTLCKNKDSKFTLPTAAETISISSAYHFTDYSISFLSGTIKSPGANGTVWAKIDGKPWGSITPIPRTQNYAVICVKE